MLYTATRYRRISEFENKFKNLKFIIDKRSYNTYNPLSGFDIKISELFILYRSRTKVQNVNQIRK